MLCTVTSLSWNSAQGSTAWSGDQGPSLVGSNSRCSGPSVARLSEGRRYAWSSATGLAAKVAAGWESASKLANCTALLQGSPSSEMGKGGWSALAPSRGGEEVPAHPAT